MADVSNVTDSSSSTATTTSSAKEEQSISTIEFMEIMITELTSQDPFEPMNNQDLVNQMAIIQQMQSNQNMTDSFEDLMGNFDDLLFRDSLNTATGMVGQMVSGPTDSGGWTTGRVIAVSTEDENVYLELDTGMKIEWNDVERLGGNSSEDIVGTMAVGLNEEGENVAGVVKAVELDEEQVILHVEKYSDQSISKVPLSQASLIDSDTADLLIGRFIEGPDVESGEMIKGTVESVVWEGDNNVLLNVLESDGESTSSVYMNTVEAIS